MSVDDRYIQTHRLIIPDDDRGLLVESALQNDLKVRRKSGLDGNCLQKLLCRLMPVQQRKCEMTGGGWQIKGSGKRQAIGVSK